jgi:penicillin-binding protein 1A
MIKARWLAFRQSPKTDTFLHKTQTYWQQTKNKLPVPRTTVAWMWTGFIALLFLGWFYFFSVEHNVFGLFGNTPGLDKLQNPRVKAASELYTADGKLLGKFYKENRNPVTFEQISPNVVKALIATEDIRFYEHAGVDARALAAAFRDALQGEGRGASTITQQLAKNLYQIRTEESEGPLYRVPGLRTLIIKTKEWITAINLERTYSKEEIITLYLNTVDFGSNAFGIKTAAKTFFGTTPDSLNTQQAATLVGLLKATTYYSRSAQPDGQVQFHYPDRF